MIDLNKIKNLFNEFHTSTPFNHVIIDNFFSEEIALSLDSEFPNYDDEKFNGRYDSPLEVKRSCNIWDSFGPTTYQVFQYLNSSVFVEFLNNVTDYDLTPDLGLHGAGLHIHPPKGKLNVHLDYSIHPKLNLQRKLNLIVYLNKDYQEDWGGELGFWSHDDDSNQPLELIKKISPKFNRAVIFDTTQNSWHGLEVPNNFPKEQDRKSIALYYLTKPDVNADTRKRALFAPTLEQKDNPDILELIKRRMAL